MLYLISKIAFAAQNLSSSKPRQIKQFLSEIIHIFSKEAGKTVFLPLWSTRGGFKGLPKKMSRKIFNSKKFMGASQRDLFCNIGNKKTAQIPLFLFPPFILFNYLPSMSLYAYSLKWRRNLIKNIIKFTLEAKNIGNFYEHFSKINGLCII